MEFTDYFVMMLEYTYASYFCRLMTGVKKDYFKITF